MAPQVTLRAGVRYTKDKVTISDFYALEGGLANPGSVGLAPDGGTTWWTQTIGAQPATRSNFQTGLAPQAQGLVPAFGKDTNNVSGKIGVDWKPGEGLLAYLSVSQGYRGVAFNGQAYNDPTELTFADPEKLTSYELGVKSEFWERRGVFNAALFHYDYKNQQFLDAFALPHGLGTGFRTVNAPKSRVDGAEFEFRAKASPDLEIGSSLGLMRSKYLELTLHSGQFVDAYGLANARVTFESSGRRGYALAAWIKNLTNRQYLAYALNQKDADTGLLGFDYALVGEPRTYGVDATLRF
jgi:outer membrane receptor protein involved in Fe transport